MVQVKPFRALRYDSEAFAADITAVVAPPYDVIEPEQQDRLMARHPANVIRLILNPKQPTDSDFDNVYTRASEYFHDWQKNGILIQESAPAFYVYQQVFQAPDTGDRIVRKGLLGLVKLADFDEKTIFPHEATLKGPIEDRFKLMQHTGANLSPIFMLYSDPAKSIEALGLYDVACDHPCWIRATEDAEPGKEPVSHAFYPLTSSESLSKIQSVLSEQSLIIADGHHRYETALAFRNWVRQQRSALGLENPPLGALSSDWALVFLGNVSDGGLKVYPTHRLLKTWPNPDFSQAQFDALLGEDFRDASPENAQFSVLYPNGDMRNLSLKADLDLNNGLPEAMSRLDTALVEYLIFRKIFAKTGEELKQAGHLRFERETDALQHRLTSQQAVCGFVMQPPPLDLMFDVVKAGYRMPQKSTYFYPKLLSGLVFNAFDPDVSEVLTTKPQQACTL
ncbi:MAG: DUF1015 domain-containing protein [Vampirovibrionales bacterium]|nr:DUF1015 domain-containing protein [Vampirovibrionales bacterium]